MLRNENLKKQKLLERGVQRMKQKRDKRNLSTNVKEDEGREDNSDDW